MLTETKVRAIKPLRYLRKVSDGGGLYLLVTPKGGDGGDTPIALSRSIRRLLWEHTPRFLSSGPGLVTSLLAIYSPTDSIRRR
jgi:hypothetical protein